MPGPPKTPTKLLELRGSARASQRGKEPRSASGEPDRPDGITDAALAVWDQVTAQLSAMKILAVSDGRAIERYCRLFVEWRTLQQFLDKMGTTYTLFELSKITGLPLLDEAGHKIVRYRQQHPEVGARNKLSVELRSLEAQFGLTPASRASIEVPTHTDIPTVRTRSRTPQPV